MERTGTWKRKPGVTKPRTGARWKRSYNRSNADYGDSPLLKFASFVSRRPGITFPGRVVGVALLSERASSLTVGGDSRDVSGRLGLVKPASAPRRGDRAGG